MNFPSASPNENMNIDNSINPIPARRAERSSAAGEILAKRVIDDRRVLLAPSWPGSSRPSTSFVPRCFKDVDARERRQVYVVCARQTTMPGHDELSELVAATTPMRYRKAISPRNSLAGNQA